MGCVKPDNLLPDRWCHGEWHVQRWSQWSQTFQSLICVLKMYMSSQKERYIQWKGRKFWHFRSSCVSIFQLELYQGLTNYSTKSPSSEACFCMTPKLRMFFTFKKDCKQNKQMKNPTCKEEYVRGCMWPSKPKIFTTCPFTEKVYLLLKQTMRLR